MSTLRIASFNLKDFFEPRNPTEEETVAEKVAHVAREIGRARADVVALQEVGSETLLAHALARAGAGSWHVHAGPPDPRGIRNAVASRLPLAGVRIHHAAALPFPRLFSGDHEPFGARIPMRRGVVHATIDVAGLGVVHVLTLHFKSRLGAAMRDEGGAPLSDASAVGRGEAQLRSFVQRSAEALFTRRVIERLFEEDPGALLCVLGDFNDTHDALPTRIVRGAHGQGDDPRELVAAHVELEPARRFSVLHGGVGEQIDHVLLSRPLHRRVRRAWIANEALRDHGPHEPNGPLEPDSDHALVAVELGLE